MARPLNSGTLDQDVSRRLRRRLAMTTILAAAPFLGYGRQAYAACDPSPSPTFICSGANATTQTINVNNADVSTVPGFSVNTGLGDGITIAGDGHIQFTDENASTIISQSGNGLIVRSTGDDGPIPGAVTVTLGGGSTVTGYFSGIIAENNGSGDLAVTADGDVLGSLGDGISAFNSSSGGSLTITTGVGTDIEGGVHGIDARNEGSGALKIIANGDVNSTDADGIHAFNAGSNLGVTTGLNSVVSGYEHGIYADNDGDGPLIIEANGEVTGTNDDGIHAFNSGNGQYLTITTGAGSNITGGFRGINATNYGAGNLDIKAYGQVTGEGNDGIVAQNGRFGVDTGSGDLKVLTGAASVVSGYNDGIDADNYGHGKFEITVNGEVTGQDNNGGLSKPRYKRFEGLALDDRLKATDSEPWCGVQVIDLKSGTCVQWFRVDGAVAEIFDVALLPGVACPMALGFASNEIKALITHDPLKPEIPSAGPSV